MRLFLCPDTGQERKVTKMSAEVESMFFSGRETPWHGLGTRVETAGETLLLAEEYMAALGKSFEELSRKRVFDAAVEEYISLLLPVDSGASAATEKGILKLREDVRKRYYHAPDLKGMGKNGYCFVNAVADFATHASPRRETRNYRETLFSRTMEGNPVTDKAYRLVMAA